MAHDKPDLLELVIRSQSIVEEIMWQEVHKTIQTKIMRIMYSLLYPPLVEDHLYQF